MVVTKQNEHSIVERKLFTIVIMNQIVLSIYKRYFCCSSGGKVRLNRKILHSGCLGRQVLLKDAVCIAAQNAPDYLLMIGGYGEGYGGVFVYVPLRHWLTWDRFVMDIWR